MITTIPGTRKQRPQKVFFVNLKNHCKTLLILINKNISLHGEKRSCFSIKYEIRFSIFNNLNIKHLSNVKSYR